MILQKPTIEEELLLYLVVLEAVTSAAICRPAMAAFSVAQTATMPWIAPISRGTSLTWMLRYQDSSSSCKALAHTHTQFIHVCPCIVVQTFGITLSHTFSMHMHLSYR